ncbi:biotin transporter BioY [candidate division TA06 bacterium]|nr:biotin transporter BioY [candidate division TA06 bacterium]
MEKILTMPVILDKKLSVVLGVFLFAALTALGAFVRVPLPFTPVPLTLQVFFVLLSAMVLGPKAVFSQVLYVIMGLTGLPVFTGASAGFSHLFGPTGGYLLGFIAASWAVSRIATKGAGAFKTALALMIGLAVIYLLGSIQLGLWLGLGQVKTIQLGILPFIVGDLLKLAAVLASARLLER